MAKVELIASGGGRFEVLRNGEPIFLKSKLRRHAGAGEVVRLLKEAETSGEGTVAP